MAIQRRLIRAGEASGAYGDQLRLRQAPRVALGLEAVVTRRLIKES